MERVAIFPGSFDPYTKGHVAIVDEALRLFDRVVVAIGENINKRGMLTTDERKRLIDDLYSAEPRVECMIYGGLTGDFARSISASAIIRGVRNSADFEYEQQIASINRRIFPGLATVVLMTPYALADVSSSAVRELHAFSHSVEAFMPEGIELEKYIK